MFHCEREEMAVGNLSNKARTGPGRSVGIVLPKPVDQRVGDDERGAHGVQTLHLMQRIKCPAPRIRTTRAMSALAGASIPLLVGKDGSG